MRGFLRLFAAIAFAGATLGLAPASVSAAGVTVKADLEGQPIKPEAIPDFYCHDRDFPLIHCFRTAHQVDAAISYLDGEASTQLLTATDYVIMYSGQTYSGSYMYVSQNYDILAFIGWNDRVRSYRGLNAALGTFWTDWYATGIRADFCCNVFVPGLPPEYDRAFSSVYRRSA